MRHSTCVLVLVALLGFAGPATAQGPSLLGVGSGAGEASATGVGADAGEGLAAGDLPDSGALVRDHDTGFDPRRDAPAFGNFTSLLGPDGDCMGISFVTRQLFCRVQWRGDLPRERGADGWTRALTSSLVKPVTGAERITIGGFTEARAASRDKDAAAAMRRVMTLGQLRNLHPVMFRGALPVRAWAGEHAKLARMFEKGRPAVMGFCSPPSLSGHAVLAYRMLEFERRTFVYLYDCNLGPLYEPGAKDATSVSVLVYDRATDRVGFHPAYARATGYAYDSIFVCEGSSTRVALSAPTSASRRFVLP